MGQSQSSGWRFGSPQPTWSQQPQYYPPPQPGITLTLGGKHRKTRRNNKSNNKTRRNRK